MDRHLAIQCFCRVVETGSFAAAARDMNCSRSVVTKYIGQLEQWTGNRLLSRTTRSMHLTAAGERFYDYARRVVADTTDMLSALRDSQARPSGRVVVSAPVSLTLGFLADHLQAFREAFPQVQLEVRLTDRAVDLVREGVDVALRGQAQLEDSTLVAIPLMQFDRVLAASPAYWRRHGKPDHPRALSRHNCLPYLLGSDALRWKLAGPDGEHIVEAGGTFRTDNSLFLVHALLHGAGVGLVPAVLVRHYLESGALETVLADYRAEPRNLFAVYASRSYLPARVSALVRFLKTRLEGTSTSRNRASAPAPRKVAASRSS